MNLFKPEAAELSKVAKGLFKKSLKEGSNQEKFRALQELSMLLLKNNSDLTDEGKKFATDLADSLLNEALEVLSKAPDSKEVRAVKRALRPTRWDVQTGIDYLESKPDPAMDPKGFYKEGSELLLRHLQVVVTLWSDVLEEKASGQEGFCFISLFALCIEEALVAIHLIRHGFAHQALSHIRTIQEAMDLIQFFNENPEKIAVWAADPKKAWNETKPFKVRAALKKDEIFKTLYEQFSRMGSHPTFEGVWSRVRRLDKKTDRKPLVLTVSLGNSYGSREGITALLFLSIFLIDLLGKVIQKYELLLNQDECKEVLQKNLGEVQSFLIEKVWTPLARDETQLQEMKHGFDEIFKKAKSILDGV